MNEQNFELAKGLVDGAYINQGAQSLKTRQNLFKVLLSQRKIPEEGWDDETIEYFLQEMALMDSNNFVGNVGAGERESRVFSNLVSKRHYRMGHGIGRSGDIAAVQPKAAGSSLINKMTNYLALDAIKIAGVQVCEYDPLTKQLTPCMPPPS
jgi:O-phospho-L-seryl-tRNASec:L-selenocysteinyl-tRNA synthase